MKKLTINILLIVFGIFLTSSIPDHNQSNKFKIIGYFYNRWGNVNNIQFGYLNTINYCFASITPTSEIGEDFDPIKLRQVVSEAHKRNVKVLVTIGGPKANNQFKTMAGSEQLRKTFINSVLMLVKNYNLDGIDIDWEYPIISDGSSNNFSTLLKELYPLLTQQNKDLSISANATGYYADCIPTSVFPNVSYINIMAYDDPNKSRLSHSSYTFAKEALDYWLNQRNLPSNKAILGVPSYGKSNQDKKVAYYKDLVSEGANPHKDSYESIDYNGINTISQKATLAKQRAGGIFMWEINLDTKDSTSLLRTIYAICK